MSSLLSRLPVSLLFVLTDGDESVTLVWHLYLPLLPLDIQQQSTDTFTYITEAASVSHASSSISLRLPVYILK